MKRFSILSMIFMVIGILLFGFNWIIVGYSEPIVLFGFISSLIGIVLSFIAIAKQEVGTTKFISLLSFFVVLFLLTWFEPFQILHILTWIKSISY